MEQNLVDSGLASDVIAYLISRENQVLKIWMTSPQLNKRRYLVDWISDLCLNFKLNGRTVHLAVRILDLFMDRHNIVEEQLLFVAVGCVLIATKYEETDDKVPKLSKLNKFLPRKYDRKSFIDLEVMLFSFLNWNIALPTAELYCETLSPFILEHSDVIHGSAVLDVNLVHKKLQEFVKYFLEVSLQCSELIAESPLAIASSAIFCARQVLCLKPQWPSKLKFLTGHPNSECFKEVSQFLLDVYYQKVDRGTSKAMRRSQTPTTCPDSPAPPRKKTRVIVTSMDEGYVSEFTLSPVEESTRLSCVQESEELLIIYEYPK